MTLEPPARVDEPDATSPEAEAPTSRRTGRRWIAIALVAALVAAGCYLLWQTNTADADNDGLTNKVETSGWQTQDGTLYFTDPYLADTDSDGLTDADEAGALVTAAGTGDVYAGYSHPLVRDTDEDGLPDGGEADLGLDPRDRDMDDDELSDGYEVDVAGTEPETADTDGDGLADGYEDANRETQDLDPLVVDEQISMQTYAEDFERGFLAGELEPGDSLAWLAGNLVSGALPVAGTLADVRDAIGLAMHGDWVGAGFNAFSVVPMSEAVTIPRKVAMFLKRNPRLAVDVARLVARAGPIPDAIKLRVAREIYRGWDDLVAAGASERALLQLQRGLTDLDALSAALKRSNQVAGVPARPFSTGKNGELALEGMYGAKAKGVDWQVRASTVGCVPGCDSNVRIFDVLVDGVAHESKVGRVAFSRFTERQIRKDAWLIENGRMDGAHWHFFASSYSNTIGADPRVLDLLDEVGIPYTIHLPAGS